MAETIAAANAEARQHLIAALEGRGAHLSFDDAIRDFPVELMNTSPAHVPYTFWHQLEHIRIAQWDLLKYITDPKHRSPNWPKEYWPERSAQADQATWDRTVAQYRADRDALTALLAEERRDLFAPVAHMENRSIMRSVLLVIDHTAYHLGEFVMARQILGAWESELA